MVSKVYKQRRSKKVLQTERLRKHDAQSVFCQQFS
ncbi:unnamed protein product [Schistosoma mattheei]|uniref:Uncharacterized protein n=1 Tax=Schistosoma mattheei TaxID=31246 RepID=A0A183PXP3_9TREM|nr:unnamed protein product [Schistosoma mattheei]